MDSDRLSSICAGLGIAEEDENGAVIGYTKGEYCLGQISKLLGFSFSFLYCNRFCFLARVSNLCSQYKLQGNAVLVISFDINLDPNYSISTLAPFKVFDQ